MIAFFKTDRKPFFIPKSVGDTSCYYHILSQDAFVIIQIQRIHTCILKDSSKTCIFCSLEKRDR